MNQQQRAVSYLIKQKAKQTIACQNTVRAICILLQSIKAKSHLQAYPTLFLSLSLSLSLSLTHNKSRVPKIRRPAWHATPVISLHITNRVYSYSSVIFSMVEDIKELGHYFSYEMPLIMTTSICFYGVVPVILSKYYQPDIFLFETGILHA